MNDPIDVVAGWERAWNSAHAFGFAKIFPGSRIAMGEPRTRTVGVGGALVQCTWHLSGQVSPTGEPVGDRDGVFTFVLEQQRDASWSRR